MADLQVAYDRLTEIYHEMTLLMEWIRDRLEQETEASRAALEVTDE